MNNPQRRSKVNDIFMQAKTYDLHMKRLQQIACKPNLQKYFNEEAHSMQHYVKQLKRYKKETKQRLSEDVQHQNNKIISKLIQIENSRYAQPKDQGPKHFNSYWTERKVRQNRLQQNLGLVKRLISTQSLVPTLKQLKRQYKHNRKLSQNCKRFPSILQHQMDCRRRFSSSRME